MRISDRKTVSVNEDPVEAYLQGWKDGREDLVEWIKNNPPKLWTQQQKQGKKKD